MSWTTLPAWTYQNAEFQALEKEAIFMRSWQLVGHVSELKKPGDYLRFDVLGESAVVVRDQQGKLRAFHNVCRHRAFRLVDKPAGHCGSLLTCRYHGFSYDLSGRLVAVAAGEDFEGLDKSQYGLVPIELESYLGFVFIRFVADDGPHVREQLAPFHEALELYRTEAMTPLMTIATNDIRADWKVAVENNIEAYHVPVAHPGLQRLYGRTYTLEVQPLGVSRGGGSLHDEQSTNWSERHYQRVLPDIAHLPPDRKRAWLYYSLFPNVAFEFYPDQIAFYQLLPVAPGRSVSRAGAYALADDRREMRAARYLNGRINRQVTREDVDLVEGVQCGVTSRGYRVGQLSRREARVRQFQALLREKIPVAGCLEAPEAGTIAARNRQLSSRLVEGQGLATV